MARPSHQWEISSKKHMEIEEEEQNKYANLNLPIIVDPIEAERLIEKLRKFELNEIGTSEWFEQHRIIEKLNLQSHQNAMKNSDEYILETFITFNKLDILLYNLYIIEIWKEQIYPYLLHDLVGRNNMRLYFIFYHEATLINLLEVFFYYQHCIESLSEKLLDLIDYISRKLTRLNDTTHYDFRSCDLSNNTNSASLSSSADPQTAAKEYADSLASRTPLEELQQHWLEIEFRICVSCVSLARFISEHADHLPLSILSRITDTHDYLLLLIPLIENPPWTRRLENGKWQKLIDLKWTNIEPINLLKITKLEGQLWISLYHLIAKNIFRERYYLNTFRKGQLLRVRKYINELLLDQLPFLADVQRYMDELIVLNVPEPNTLGSGGGSVFLFQQVATVYESIRKNKDFAKIAEEQKRNVFTMTDRNDKDLLKIAELYSDDNIEHVIDPLSLD